MLWSWLKTGVQGRKSKNMRRMTRHSQKFVLDRLEDRHLPGDPTGLLSSPILQVLALEELLGARVLNQASPMRVDAAPATQSPSRSRTRGASMSVQDKSPTTSTWGRSAAPIPAKNSTPHRPDDLLPNAPGITDIDVSPLDSGIQETKARATARLIPSLTSGSSGAGGDKLNNVGSANVWRRATTADGSADQSEAGRSTRQIGPESVGRPGSTRMHKNKGRPGLVERPAANPHRVPGSDDDPAVPVKGNIDIEARGNTIPFEEWLNEAQEEDPGWYSNVNWSDDDGDGWIGADPPIEEAAFY